MERIPASTEHPRVAQLSNDISKRAVVNIELVHGCNNGCPACTFQGSFDTMTDATLDSVLDDLRATGIAAAGFDFRMYGLGNAIKHPRFETMVARVRSAFPESKIVLSIDSRDVADNLDTALSVDTLVCNIQPSTFDESVVEDAFVALDAIADRIAVRPQYLVPSLSETQTNRLRFLASLSSGYRFPLLVTRFVTHTFGFRDTDWGDVIEIDDYDPELHIGYEQKFRDALPGLVVAPVKGYTEAGERHNTLNPGPAWLYGVDGALHICFMRTSPVSHACDLLDNYINIMSKACGGCPVLKTDCTVVVTDPTQPSLSIRQDCGGGGMSSDDIPFCACPSSGCHCCR